MSQVLWRSAQRAIALVLLVVLSPALLAIALAVRVTSPGPVFFRTSRISGGRAFAMVKFRSMRMDSVGPAITAAQDPRVTRLGRLLRRWKLDELPQLWNVVRGEMLLVGPRPEDPRYVNWSDPLHALVFGARSGMTGPTALAFRNEEQVLFQAAQKVAMSGGRTVPTGDDIEQAYRQIVLPRKLELDADYLRTRGIARDLRVLLSTITGSAHQAQR